MYERKLFRRFPERQSGGLQRSSLTALSNWNTPERKGYQQIREGGLLFLARNCFRKCRDIKCRSAVSLVMVLMVLLLSIRLRYPTFPTFHNPYTAPPPLPDRSFRDRVDYVRRIVQGNRHYPPIVGADDQYHVLDCPLHPPPGYPREYPILDVLGEWPVPDINVETTQRSIHQGVCIFDFSVSDSQTTLRQQVRNYQQAEVPFVVRNDPNVLRSVERWNTDDYLLWKLHGRAFKGEFSKTTSMLYWRVTQNSHVPDDWIPPTEIRPLTYAAWRAMAAADRNSSINNKSNHEYAYLRMDGCHGPGRCDGSHIYPGVCSNWYNLLAKLSDANFVFDDLKFYNPDYPDASDLYLVDKSKQRGIQCRFGAPGLVAEDHFDHERNSISILSGERRYILGHPGNCVNMTLYPQLHPLERHSRVDWNNPNLDQFPLFEHVHVNEVVLQAGDVLYLPTYWFHHIVSLNKNIQCNTRTGHSLDYDKIIDDCGFLYSFP